MKRAAIWLFLVVGGCAGNSSVSLTKAPDYQTSLMQTMVGTMAADQSLGAVPEAVKSAYANCASAFYMSFVTPQEKTRLDAAAQAGAIASSDAQQIDSAVTHRVGEYTFNRLSGTCPNDVPDFEKYLPALKLN